MICVPKSLARSVKSCKAFFPSKLLGACGNGLVSSVPEESMKFSWMEDDKNRWVGRIRALLYFKIFECSFNIRCADSKIERGTKIDRKIERGREIEKWGGGEKKGGGRKTDIQRVYQLSSKL